MGNLVARGLSLGSLVGVVLGQVGPGGCLWWRFVGVTLYVVVFLVRGGPTSPRGGAFSLFLKAFGIGIVGLLPQFVYIYI